MVLSVAERKHRMPYGGQQEVADELNFDATYISLVMAGKVRPETQAGKLKLRLAQEALARKLGVSVEDAFPEYVTVAAVAV